MTPLTDELLKELEETAKWATPDLDDDSYSPICAGCASMVDVRGDDADWYADPICDYCLGEFARAVRNKIPLLVSEIRRLRTDLSREKRVGERLEETLKFYDHNELIDGGGTARHALTEAQAIRRGEGE